MFAVLPLLALFQILLWLRLARRPHRGCAYERFTPDGPIALLPKGDEVNRCSLVWTTPAEQVETRMTWRDDVFIAHAEATFGERLGEFKELGRRQAHPLARESGRASGRERVGQ